MGKISIQDLSSALVERKGLNKKEASAFISTMFDIVQQELEKDKIVKIKGLGTFKIIDVEDRESVNVNTGERVLIESHGKITFTPDALMKELVNKPFSQFETVVLNDGVDFEDETTKEEPLSQPVDTNSDPSSRRLVDFGLGSVAADLSSFPVIEDVVGKKENKSEEEVSKTETVLDADTEKEADDNKALDNNKETDNLENTENSQNSESQEISIEKPEYKNRNWLYVMIACFVGLLIGYITGNYFPYNFSSDSQNDASVHKVVTQKKKVVVKKTKPQAQKESAVLVKKDSVVKITPPPADTIKKSTVQEQAKPSGDIHSIYAAKDARVRLGAYRIVGTDRVVKAKKGETTSLLSRRYLGKGMECYVEVYNGFKSNTVLKNGQEIKIPKLKYKMKKKKRLRTK